MSIDRNIRQRSKDIGLSMQDLAIMANLPTRTVHSIWTGESKDPRVSTIKKIAIALGTTVDKLIFDENTQGDLMAMVRELETLNPDKREYAKRVLRAVLIQTKNEQLSE